MYFVAILAAASSFIGLIIAASYHWPWWVFVALVVALLVSFLAGCIADE